jgi:hypothetical protein
MTLLTLDAAERDRHRRRQPQIVKEEQRAFEPDQPASEAVLTVTNRSVARPGRCRDARRPDTSVIHRRRPDRSDVVGVGRFKLPASCSQI